MIERKRCKRKSTLHLENGSIPPSGKWRIPFCQQLSLMYMYFSIVSVDFPLPPLYPKLCNTAYYFASAWPRISLSSFDVAAALEAGGGKGMPQCVGMHPGAPRPGADSRGCSCGSSAVPLAALYRMRGTRCPGWRCPAVCAARQPGHAGWEFPGPSSWFWASAQRFWYSRRRSKCG